MTIRMIAPPTIAQGLNPCVVNGRSYATPVGTALNVPDFDAGGLEANGWLRCATNGAGTTAQRPTAALLGNPIPRGFEYADSTLGVNVIWDGAGWKSAVTGAAA
ncbi:hypothetical protein [Bradyrhizobium sp. RT10b]|uniref:hypothetical protein n=1 Tax=Bradyrhizobium sp. RT10b TaxID=3156331 RepID=UPI00339B3B65